MATNPGPSLVNDNLHPSGLPALHDQSLEPFLVESLNHQLGCKKKIVRPISVKSYLLGENAHSDNQISTACFGSCTRVIDLIRDYHAEVWKPIDAGNAVFYAFHSNADRDFFPYYVCIIDVRDPHHVLVHRQFFRELIAGAKALRVFSERLKKLILNYKERSTLKKATSAWSYANAWGPLKTIDSPTSVLRSLQKLLQLLFSETSTINNGVSADLHTLFQYYLGLLEPAGDNNNSGEQTGIVPEDIGDCVKILLLCLSPGSLRDFFVYAGPCLPNLRLDEDDIDRIFNRAH